MKSILLTGILLLGNGAAHVPSSLTSPALPELHKINFVTLAPNYGCLRKQGVQDAYGNTALFLSAGRKNGPDLLFQGACGTREFPQPDYLVGSTAGDDLTVISDLGKVAIEDLRADQIFNVKRVHSPDLYTKFVSEVQIEVGHTYAVLINKSGERGFFYFTVTGYIPNERLDLKYVVKDYQLTMTQYESNGFDWSRNSE